MKETGLMFKAPLVRAILSGKKNQTRRIAKTEITMGRDSLLAPHRGRKHADVYLLPERAMEAVALSPVGQPGDRIYVRESFTRVPTVCGSDELVFAADYQDDSDKAAGVKYTPAIHMPKHDARIWLEVTGVRVERLHEISEADAKAEGAPLKNSPAAHLTSYRRGVQELWESTGGDWAANPWVWVIDFKRIERELAAAKEGAQG